MADGILAPHGSPGAARVFYVYAIRLPDSTPVYIGKGKEDRWKAHKRRTHNSHLRGLFAKYGDRLSLEKVCEELTEFESFELERFLISLIGRKCRGGPLVNQTDGGDGASGRVISEDERARRRQSMRRPEVIEKMRLSHLGKPSARRGITVSPETRERQRQSHLGHVQTQETKDKRGAKNRGQKRTAEFCAALSARNLERWAKRRAQRS